MIEISVQLGEGAAGLGGAESFVSRQVVVAVQVPPDASDQAKLVSAAHASGQVSFQLIAKGDAGGVFDQGGGECHRGGGG